MPERLPLYPCFTLTLNSRISIKVDQFSKNFQTEKLKAWQDIIDENARISELVNGINNAIKLESFTKIDEAIERIDAQLFEAHIIRHVPEILKIASQHGLKVQRVRRFCCSLTYQVKSAIDDILDL